MDIFAAVGRAGGRPGLLMVAASWIVAMVVQMLPLVLGSGPTMGSMTALFWLIVVAASSCVISSLVLLRLAVRRDIPELGVVAGFFLVGSLLPLVHGITTPGMLYGDNTSTMAAVFFTVPLASMVPVPTLFGRTHLGRTILNHWRPWVAGWLAATIVLAIVLLARPNTVPVPAPKSVVSITTALAMIAVTGALAIRQLRLACIAQDARYAIVGLGFAWFGVSAAVWFDGTPLTFSFWSAHVFDIAGVFAATVGGFIVHRRNGSIDELLQPILQADPLGALEAGLDPIVHRFVASLDEKDPITRDHVVRSASLAVALGSELHLSPWELRRVGLAALLHDLGKLEIPVEILNKTGSLSDEEFDVIRTHPTIGAEMVRRSPILDDIAPLIEAHHERVDGAGYPFGRSGDELPISARIISVCDAFDAIANTRQYRVGAGWRRALEVLEEHAGTQWDAEVVSAMVRMLEREGGPAGSTALDDIGRHHSELHDSPSCGCIDALPETVVRELEHA